VQKRNIQPAAPPEGYLLQVVFGLFCLLHREAVDHRSVRRSVRGTGIRNWTVPSDILHKPFKTSLNS
jgi:hypothetical protein